MKGDTKIRGTSDRYLASVSKTIEVVKIIVPTMTIFNLNNSTTLLNRMYKGCLVLPLGSWFGLILWNQVTENKDWLRKYGERWDQVCRIL